LIGLITAGAFLSKRERPAEVQSALVERVPQLRAVVTASGSIQAKDSVDIQAEIPGVIIELPVQEGDTVTKGQVLLKIDKFQTEADMMAARASALAAEADATSQKVQIATAQVEIARNEASKKAAEAELVQAEANWEQAQRTEQRKKKLLEQQLISPEDYETAQTQERATRAATESFRAHIAQFDAGIKSATLAIDEFKARHEAAMSRAEAARVVMDRADDLLRKTTLFAPLNGVITSLPVEIGERAVPGIQSNPQATLMTIADLSVIQAELLVDETDIVQIRQQQSVKVKVDAMPDLMLEARVTEIGNAPVSQNNLGAAAAVTSQEGKDFLVKAIITNPPPSLRPGMSCEGDILTSTRENPLVVPIQALTVREVEVDDTGRYVPPNPQEILHVRETKQGGGEQKPIVRAGTNRTELQGVFVKGPDGRVRFRPVKTGINGEMDTEVMEGLEGGEEIVIGPYKVLRTIEEGALVTVDNSKFRRFAKSGEKPEQL
jgi:HlyD family secretion protein